MALHSSTSELTNNCNCWAQPNGSLICTDERLYRPGPPIPAVLQHGISDNQSKMYAEELTSGVNQLLGGGCALLRFSSVTCLAR